MPNNHNIPGTDHYTVAFVPSIGFRHEDHQPQRTRSHTKEKRISNPSCSLVPLVVDAFGFPATNAGATWLCGKRQNSDVGSIAPTLANARMGHPHHRWRTRNPSKG